MIIVLTVFVGDGRRDFGLIVDAVCDVSDLQPNDKRDACGRRWQQDLARDCCLSWLHTSLRRAPGSA